MEEKEFDYMNVIPLVDIMLVLLTIVLTTATFIHTNTLPVNLPEAKGEKGKGDSKAVTVVIDKEGNYYMGKEKISLNVLKERLKAFGKKTEIRIKADKDSKLNSFVKLIDMLRSEGFTNISVLVKKK